MSWLFIDSHERGALRLALLQERGRSRTSTLKRRSQGVIPAIAGFASATDLKSAKGICVVSGPGSFSAIRSGVLAGNLLARLLGLPLYGISVDESRDLTEVRRRLSAGEVEDAPYVAPVYDMEPNITC